MDPVAQTLAQQQSGSAEGQGFGQFYIQGRQLGQEQQRINLSRQHLQLQQQQEQRMTEHQNLMDPLIAEQYRKQNVNLGIEATTRQKSLDIQTIKNAITPELQDLQLDFMSSPLGYGDPELRSRARQIFEKDPKTRYSQAGQEVMQGINGINVIAQEFQATDQAYARFGNKLQTYDPKTGRVTLVNTQQLALQQQRLLQAEVRLQQQAQDMMRKKDTQGLARANYYLNVIKAQRSALENGYEMTGLPELPPELFNPTSGTPAAAPAAPAAEVGNAPSFDQSAAPPQSAPLGEPGYEPMAGLMSDPTIGVPRPEDSDPFRIPRATYGEPGNEPMAPLMGDPSAMMAMPATNAMPRTATAPAAATNAPAFGLRRVERPPTTATTTSLQKQSMDADIALRQLTNIRNEVEAHPNAFGPVGMLNSWKEIGAGIFNAKADATVNRIRQKAGETFITIARSLRPDSGNMSHFELDRLRALGDLNAVENVPSVALGKAEELISLQVAKKLRIAKELKEPVPDMVLKAIDPPDAVDLFDDGLLTEADMKRTLLLMPKQKAEQALLAAKAKRDREKAERGR